MTDNPIDGGGAPSTEGPALMEGGAPLMEGPALMEGWGLRQWRVSAAHGGHAGLAEAGRVFSTIVYHLLVGRACNMPMENGIAMHYSE